METKRIGRSEGFFWLAMGIFICLVAVRTGIGVVKEPGPGFIALAAGLFMAVVGCRHDSDGALGDGFRKDKVASCSLAGRGFVVSCSFYAWVAFRLCFFVGPSWPYPDHISRDVGAFL